MPNVIVRRASPKDLPAVGRLGALLVQEHYEFDSRRFMRPPDNAASGYASFLGSQLADPDVGVLVAERDGQVVGYAYASVEDRDWMLLLDRAGVLHDIIVDAAARRQGVARQLLAGVLEFLKSRGAPRVVLTTAEANEAAQKLFASAGFRRTMIEMTRELDADPSSLRSSG